MSLPIDEILPELRRQLAAAPNLVLQAPPGAGKTTRVPLALLDQAWLGDQSILMLEPRRLAAKAAAARMAAQLGERVGETVGYRVRFDSQVSARTRVEVVTEGILTRRLQQDPELAGVGLVIFDEFHERSLHADLGLALCLEAQQALRPDLKLLVMSATLDGAAVAQLLGDAPIVSSAGRCYPVQMHYWPSSERFVAEAMAQALRRLLPQSEGGILAFLPGGGEIRRVQSLLQQSGLPPGLDLVALYGDLPRAEQDAAILPAPPGRRKLVLATPIAETSLTLEGITTVVDSGWRRGPRFDPRSGLSRLELQRIAQDSAEQRAGRAGRLGPGACYRLWEESQQTRLESRTAPEIRQADLAPLALELALWGCNDPTQLAWLDPPPRGALAQAQELLRELEALDAAGVVTALGRRMAEWPMHPRLAHMVCRAESLGWGALACETAALLSERDIVPGRERDADLGLRLRALRAYRERGRAGAREYGADPEACARVSQAAQEWQRRLRKTPGGTAPDNAAGVLLAFAYPDRIAAVRPAAPHRYRLANGRGAALLEHDGLCGQDFLAIAQLDAGEREARIYLAAPIARADLLAYLGDKIQVRERVAWDAQQGCVLAQREQRLGELLLRAEALADPGPESRRAALLEGLRQAGLAALPWDEAAREWQARVQCLREWLPEQGWPDLSDAHLAATLAHWLGPYLTGLSRMSQVNQLNLLEILQHSLDWQQRQQLDQAAPTHLEVPSGSRIRLRYQPGSPPVLAVRLQEMFGLADTPSVAQGRVKVLLHLLSPGHRPIQVTQDLRGFWERTYAEVKKELKGRYPKHYWPDDPWQAVPTRRAKPRGS